MTHLRKLMLDELQRRNYAQNTAESYVHALRDFAAYYHLPPDRLGPEQIRDYQLHLLRDRRLSLKTVKQRMAAHVRVLTLPLEVCLVIIFACPMRSIFLFLSAGIPDPLVRILGIELFYLHFGCRKTSLRIRNSIQNP